MNRLISINCALAIVSCLVFSAGSAVAQPKAAAVQPKTFKVHAPDGVVISAQEWGNPAGIEILFIHGYSQSHLSWSRQVDSDLAKSFRIITYDIRGHGGSDKPLDSVYYKDHRHWADELKAVIEQAKLNKPVLVGWSYGGQIATITALKNPSLVRSLILYEASIGSMLPTDSAEGKAAREAGAALKAHRQSLKKREHNRQFRSQLRSSLRSIRAAIDGNDLAGARSALRETISLIDRMTSKGIIHRNAAGRYKSRLTSRIAARS